MENRAGGLWRANCSQALLRIDATIYPLAREEVPCVRNGCTAAHLGGHLGQSGQSAPIVLLQSGRVHPRIWMGTDWEFIPAVAGIVCRLLQRRRAAAKTGLTGRSVGFLGGGQGRHKAGACGDLMGLAGRGLAGHLRLGTCYEKRHPVDEACCWGGRCGGGAPAQGRAD